MKRANQLFLYILTILFLFGCSSNQLTENPKSPMETSPLRDIQDKLDSGSTVTQDELDLLLNQQISNQYRFDSGTIRSLSSDGENIFVLTYSGDVYAWGKNNNQIIGTGAQGAKLEPQKVLFDSRVSFIDSSTINAAAITEDGKVYVWGNNDFGVFGNGTHSSSDTPILVPFDIPVKSLKIGERLFTVLAEDGTVYGAGDLFSLPQVTDVTTPEEIASNTQPTLEQIQMPDPIKQVNSGWQYRLFLTEQGRVYLHGIIKDQVYLQLKEIKFNEQIVKIDCMQNFWVALGRSGTLYGYGLDDYGLLNLIPQYYSSPTKLDKIGRVTDFSLGEGSILVTTEDNKVFIWGNNLFRQVSDEPVFSITQPRQVDIQSRKVVCLANGFTSGMILDDGSVHLWGANFYGQLLDGSRVSTAQLRQITAK